MLKRLKFHLSVDGGCDDFLVDGLDAHVKEEDDEDDDGGDRDETSKGCAVLGFTVVPNKRGSCKNIRFSHIVVEVVEAGWHILCQ